MKLSDLARPLQLDRPAVPRRYATGAADRDRGDRAGAAHHMAQPRDRAGLPADRGSARRADRVHGGREHPRVLAVKPLLRSCALRRDGVLCPSRHPLTTIKHMILQILRPRLRPGRCHPARPFFVLACGASTVARADPCDDLAKQLAGPDQRLEGRRHARRRDLSRTSGRQAGLARLLRAQHQERNLGDGDDQEAVEGIPRFRLNRRGADVHDPEERRARRRATLRRPHRHLPRLQHLDPLPQTRHPLRASRRTRPKSRSRGRRMCSSAALASRPRDAGPSRRPMLARGIKFFAAASRRDRCAFAHAFAGTTPLDHSWWLSISGPNTSHLSPLN